MRKPELLYKSPEGATIYSYDLTGGKTTYERFLGCLEGSCEFYGTLKEAQSAIAKR